MRRVGQWFSSTPQKLMVELAELKQENARLECELNTARIELQAEKAKFTINITDALIGRSTMEEKLASVVRELERERNALALTLAQQKAQIIEKCKDMVEMLTSLDPSQTSFFQLLNVPTNINKGTVAPVELIRKGEKDGSSEAALLSNLGIRPFSDGLVVESACDNGSVFQPEALELTDADLIAKFAARVSNVAALSLGQSHPTLAAAPHMFVNGFKNVVSVSLATKYSFPETDTNKKILNEPSKFIVAAPEAVTASAVVEEKETEESDDDIGYSLFDWKRS